MKSRSGRNLRRILLTLTLAVPSGAMAGENVSFTADDGHWLYATFYEPVEKEGPAPMAFVLHDQHADRRSVESLAAALARAGFAVLAPDLRGHGESATSATRQAVVAREARVFRDMQLDLRGAYDFLATRPGIDRARFAVIGTGTGAAVGLRYAVEDCSVDSIVCLSPRLDAPGFDLRGDLRQLRGRRILFLYGAADGEACTALARTAAGVRCETAVGPGQGLALLETDSRATGKIVHAAREGVGRSSRTIVYGSINSHIYHLPNSGWLERIRPSNLRHYSSPAEAESRGLRAARSDGPRRARRP